MTELKGPLLVLVPDRISETVVKGEYQPRYYNPGGLFDDVHLLMTNDDDPDPAALQRTVGHATLHLHNLPEDHRLTQRAWGPWRAAGLRRWARKGVEIARRIRPALMRCHGADWNAYLARRIKESLGVPYTVSLHINPDVNAPRRFLKSELSREEQRHNAFFEYIEREGLRGADLVMPVYEPIVPYLERMGVTRYEVLYNVLNGDFLRRKETYGLHRPAKVISVGRLIAEKSPRPLIEAVAAMPGVTLTVVGDGPLAPSLKSLASRLGVDDRVLFEPAVPNDELCARLPGFDAFAVYTEYFEMNKSVLEAVLTGLPVVINRRAGAQIPELEGDFVHKVDGSSESYREAFETLFADDQAREALGRRAYAHARERWSPSATEARFAEVYRQLAANDVSAVRAR